MQYVHHIVAISTAACSNLSDKEENLMKHPSFQKQGVSLMYLKYI